MYQHFKLKRILILHTKIIKPKQRFEKSPRELRT